MRTLSLGLLFALVFATAPAVAKTDAPAASGGAERAAPGLRVTKLVTGLDHPWDVEPIGGGRVLITERDEAQLMVADSDGKRRVRFPSGTVWVSGETGLMSLAIDPGFAEQRPLLHLPGLQQAGRRARRPRDRVAAQRRRYQGHDDPDARQGVAHVVRPARRVPLADQPQRSAARRDG